MPAWTAYAVCSVIHLTSPSPAGREVKALEGCGRLTWGWKRRTPAAVIAPKEVGSAAREGGRLTWGWVGSGKDDPRCNRLGGGWPSTLPGRPGPLVIPAAGALLLLLVIPALEPFPACKVTEPCLP